MEGKPTAWEMKRDDGSYHSITPNEGSAFLQAKRKDQDWTVTPLYTKRDVYLALADELEKDDPNGDPSFTSISVSALRYRAEQMEE